MVEDKLLTIRETSIILGVSEKEVIELAESGRLPAYKVAGLYLRFKREQIEDYRKSNKPLSVDNLRPEKTPFKERISDFFYFYDFYLAAIFIIVLMLVIIFRGY